MTDFEKPRVHYGMTPDELDRLVEWNRTRCHQRGCENRATAIYAKTQGNAHGGRSTFRYQRCAAHALGGSDSVTPIVDASPAGRVGT